MNAHSIRQRTEDAVNRDRKKPRSVLAVIAACLAACGTLRADDSHLTVGRLFGTGEFATDPLPARRWSKIPSTYFTLEKGDLVRHDPATGTKEILVPAAAFVPKGAKEPLGMEGYEFSADESKLLLFTNSRRVWRRNTRGDYWVLDVKARSLQKLGGDAAPSSLMFATFSPDGSRVAFVRENNLYVQDLSSLKVAPLTADGSKTLINGTSDWVNEEELDLRNCFRWSPDGKHILFWQFDTAGVAEFHLVDNVVGKSPKITSFAYPKVGEKNSATRLGVVPAAGGAVRWLDLPGDPREHYLPHADWTPGGNRVMVQQFNRLQTELKVWQVDPVAGQVKNVFTETDAAWLENENPWRWLDGGMSFLWLSERSGWRHVYRGAPRRLAAGADHEGRFRRDGDRGGGRGGRVAVLLGFTQECDTEIPVPGEARRPPEGTTFPRETGRLARVRYLPRCEVGRPHAVELHHAAGG